MEHLRQRFWRRTRTQVLVIVLAIYWVVLCVGTHVPGGIIVDPPTSDKLLHAGAYAGLAFLLALLSPQLGLRRWRPYAGILLIAVCYGAVDELGQIPIPGRNADADDWVADVFGAGVGLTLYWAAARSWAALSGIIHVDRNEVG